MDKKFMKESYNEARKAYAIGEVPVGAVIVKDDIIIGKGFNKRESLNSPIAHAEIEAIHEASEYLNSWRLLGCTLYVTLEPCAMCAGAIVNSRIDRVVIGTRDDKRGCCGTIMNLLNDDRFNHQADVKIGILEEECSSILSDFFKELRKGLID